MIKLLSKPWFLATLALVILLGTQAGAFYMYWADMFPKPQDVLIVKHEDPDSIRWSFSSDGLHQLKTELDDRLSAVDAKEAGLASYEARLVSDRAEIEAIKSEVEQMRDSLMSEIMKVEEWEKKNLKNLATTYNNLDPEAAIRIFSELDDPTVAKIMRSMDTETVGDILGEMAAQNGGNEALVKRAAKLSNLLRLFTEDV
ncbi:MAG: flagellar motility protein MotE (MotC chaperone) [Candidatus Pelagisphaera sp.]|jgi:flagellar motility protein MotE (MotC chaperone)